MDFSFSDDQLLFRDTVADLLADECTPAAVRTAWDDGSGRVPGLWPALAEMGVVGMTAPEASGGLGMDEVDLVLLLQEIGRAALPDPVLEHTAVALPLLAEAGGAEEIVSAAAAGARVLTIGLRPAGGAGSPYVSAAVLADHLVLEADDGIHLVDRSAVELHPVASVDHTRCLARAEWQPTPSTRLIEGAEADAAAALAFDRAAMATAAQCVGLGRAMLELTVGYVTERHQFGKPVGSYQAIKHHLADVMLALEFAAPLVYGAAEAIAADRPERARDVSAAKATASDAAELAARAALQCHGAIGYTVEYDLHMWMKRAWALARAWGGAEYHRARVADALGLD